MNYKTGPIPVWLLLSLFAVSHSTEPICTSALPTIAHQLGITGNLAQLSSSVYFCGFATGIVTLGRISDIFGRRKIVFFGLSLYCISSTACSFVTDIQSLLILRFIQAYGVSVGSVIAQAMARDSYSGRALSEVYVSIAICMSYVPSFGSMIGGYIVEYLGWQYNFRTLSLTSITLLIISLYNLPETNRYMDQARYHRYFDVLKTVLSDRVLLLYAWIVGAFNGMMFGFYIEAPFIFIQHFHFAPSEYGKLGFMITAGHLAGGLMNRYMVKSYFDNQKIIMTGLKISVASCIALFCGICLMPPDPSRGVIISIICIPVMLHIIGHNFAIPLILRFALEDYSKVTGTAGSIFGCLYYLLVAAINYMVSRLHGDSIVPFATLFLCLSITCLIAFLLIQKYKPMMNSHDAV